MPCAEVYLGYQGPSLLSLSKIDQLAATPYLSQKTRSIEDEHDDYKDEYDFQTMADTPVGLFPDLDS